MMIQLKLELCNLKIGEPINMAT